MEEAGRTLESDLRAKLQPFLIQNPESDIEVKNKVPVIARPWGDDTIELRVPEESEFLVDALNAVRLPPRFTAIWHEDNKEFEIIFTAMPIEEELQSRGFEFRFGDHDYKCAFGLASQRLRSIALASRPLGPPSQTNYRNLQSFHILEHSQEKHPDSRSEQYGDPTSFWISGIKEYNESYLIELARILNFYMGYFDRESPRILVHDVPARLRHPHPERYPSGEFPEIIQSRDIDQHLLSLWESASFPGGDVFLRFIHYYQILEYAAFYYVRDDLMQTIQRVLTAPDSAARPQAAARQILEAMVAERAQDETKITEVIRRCVDPDELWRELDNNRKAFSESVAMDGGFQLPAIMSASESLNDFKATWYSRYPSALQRIRNALVHARESRQSTMIAPTRSNQEMLLPWLGPLSLAAARVMVYSNT